jgi:hypothetical protein
MKSTLVLSLSLAVLAAGLAPAAAPPPRARKTGRLRLPESVVQVYRILVDPPLKTFPDPASRVSKSRLGWDWLARQHGIDPRGKLDARAFRGPRDLFARLDRDGDGVLHAGDFDWSDKAPFVRQQAVATALFRRLDRNGNGQISASEWQAAFEALAGKKGHLTPEDLYQALYPPSRPARAPASARPSRWALLMGYLSGELGSLSEGPNPGQKAPAFTLSTPDGKKTISLSSYRGKKPVVLIFGNFT